MKTATILTLTSVIFASVLLGLVGPLVPAVAQLKTEGSLSSRILLNEEISDLVFSPDGYTVASMMHRNRIGLWDIRTGQRTATIQADIDAAVEDPEEYIPTHVAFSPDGRTLAALANANKRQQSNRLHLWDVRTGRHIATTKASGFFDLSFSPDGQTIVTGNSRWFSDADATKILYFWDAHTLQLTATLEHKVWTSHRVAFSPDGRMLVTVGTANGDVNFWDAHTLQRIGSLEQQLRNLQKLAFLPDGQTLFARYWKGDSFVVDFWDVSTRQHIGTFPSNTQFAVSPVADILAAPMGQGTINLWDVSTHQPRSVLTLRSPDFRYAWSIAFSPDGQTLAARVSEPDDREAIYLWKFKIAVDTTVIDIPDPNLRVKVADALGKESNAAITAVDMLVLRVLEAPNANIRNLIGLEYARNLESLDLSSEYVEGEGHVNSNTISDFSPIADLTLKFLDLSYSGISDVSPLSGLTQLTALSLRNNTILDISPLIGLDLSGRAWNSTGLDIRGNPLSYASINTHIPAIQAKGVEVRFDSRTPTRLVKILGAGQEAIVNTALPLPFVVEVRDQEHRAFAGVPVKFAVAAGRGRLSATTVTTDAMGRAAAHLTLGRTAGTTTVRVTATDISQSVQFTATAILRSTPIIIPDANLRVRIMETLRKPFDETPTAADILKLTTLNANNANIFDLTGLQHAANLRSLSLTNNRISNVTPLAGLTQLTTLNLKNNRISNVRPLTGLTHLEGAKVLRALYLQGNPLSDISIYTHIPMLQAVGVNVRFDSVTTHPKPIVRLIYFLPRNRQPQPDINAKMDRLIKDVHRFYAEQMENHGLGRKTFEFETDAHGNAVVYHINGKFNDVYYHDESSIVWEEIEEQFGRSTDIYLTALDVSTELIGTGENDTACGIGGRDTLGGTALIPASGHCFNLEVTAHELGHAFDLVHDFRDDTYLMSYGSGKNRLSQCAAEWLDVHRAFNPRQVTANKHNEWATIEMLPPSFVAPPNTIRFRFKISDPQGLHQVQLLTPTLHGSSKGSPELVNYKGLNGTRNQTVEFVLTDLGPVNESVSLQVIDKSGSMSWSVDYSIDVASLLSGSEVVTTPDPIAVDVNGDGVVNIQDLVLVASSFGQTGENAADVNGDGVVNISDLVLVAGALGEGAAAAPALHASDLEGLTAEEVQDMLTQARQMAFTDPAYLRGIAVLEQLLAILLPTETTLLANYPNPFNPETWIPYHLAKSADVTLTIYTLDGKVVRHLDLGHQAAGYYQNKARAAYWDGRNAVGERVASGIYFYTLTAGDFAATRKMLILK